MKKYLSLWGLGVAAPLAMAGVTLLMAKAIHPYFYLFCPFFVFQAINHSVGNLRSRKGKNAN